MVILMGALGFRVLSPEQYGLPYGVLALGVKRISACSREVGLRCRHNVGVGVFG